MSIIANLIFMCVVAILLGMCLGAAALYMVMYKHNITVEDITNLLFESEEEESV